MIQTTLFNYFDCNHLIKQKSYLKQSFKQTLINNHFPIKPKKRTILNYFKEQKGKYNEPEPVFDLVLVDIINTNNKNIKCIKKNMYDKDLKYISISYRWGEMEEQLLNTPDYTAHITSFSLDDLELLIDFIKREPDLKEIPYLWIDAISIDQQNHDKKKETILKMSDIYKSATYILAIPDLHLKYLWKNPANLDKIRLVMLYSKEICQNNLLINNHHYQSATITMNDKNIKKVYQFLAYLIEDWSNRAWVTSEYQIAKEKKETPLKYMFMSLLFGLVHRNNVTFFSYFFDHSLTLNTHNKNTMITCKEADSDDKFIQFLKSRFIDRLHLDVLLNSNATRNEDRFNAILPSWKKYQHLIQNKHTITKWNITNMTSVRLKLYEMMDLWDRARLLYACSNVNKIPIIPTFASQHREKYLGLIEIDNLDYAFERYSVILSNYMMEMNKSRDDVDYIKANKMDFGLIYTNNLIDIQLKKSHDQYSLSIQAKKYFMVHTDLPFDQELISIYSFNNNDSLKIVFIPFFTFTIPDYTHIPSIYGSGIYLLENMTQNRWILIYRHFILSKFDQYSPYINNYLFNIY